MSAGMARHGSAGAFSGFSVCQPALGASLQWLPAIGTPELDDMINAFLPGPASIQDKRAHISMDFFEYYRQTGENFKFYPVAAAGSFTPATASPATPALFDAAFAPTFSNQSPVLSDQGSWTQSPAPRASVSKKSTSSSSSRQQQQTAVDFASHPGMRILTKDGRDVTNSASRGCKTKEQRDHAHLMRIIKACDACRKKKTRCDPSHRKRTGSQASAGQAEPKPAKRPRKADESPPVAVVDAPTEFAVGDAFAPEALAFPSFETTYPESFEEFWTDFTTLEQDPVAAVAADFSFNDFVFDSFINPNPQTFSPSEGSSATSPSQVLTPSLVDGSPISASDLGVVGVAGEAVFQDMAVPYLAPGVAHGTNYVDFNLYSPGPEVYEDPVLQMRDLGSQHSSPQSSHSPSRVSATALSSHISTNLPIAASRVELDWCLLGPLPSSHFVTNHNRLVEEGGTERGSPPDRQPTNHMRLDSYGDGDSGGYSPGGSSSLRTPDSQSSASTALESTRHSDIARHSFSTRHSDSASIVVANMPQSSVSPSRTARPRRIMTGAPPGVPQVPPATQAAPATDSQSSLPTSHKELSRATPVAISPAAGAPSRQFVGDVAPPGTLGYNRGCAGSAPLSRQRLAGRARGPSPQGQSAVASTTPLLSTPPTRRLAGAQADATTELVAPFLLQLAVLGLVSLLCAAGLVRAAHPAPVGQATLANVVLALASLSLSRASAPSSRSSTACGGAGVPDAIQSWVGSVLHLPLPAAESSDFVKSKIQPASSAGGPLDFRSWGAQWARGFGSRGLRPVRMLGLA